MIKFPLLKGVSLQINERYIDDFERISLTYKSLDIFETDYAWSPDTDRSITPVIRYEWDVLSKNLGEKYISQANKVLSIGGGGNSPTLKWISESLEYLCILNPSERDLNLYREKTIEDERVLLIRGIGEMIPLADDSFDLVEIPATLDHCMDHKKVLDECYRVLRIGGRIALTGGNARSWYRDLVSKLGLTFLDAHQHHHTIDLDPSSIKNLLTSTGFSDVEISTNYFLKLPKFIERLLNSEKKLSIYGIFSNVLMPKLVGELRGGMLLAGARK